MVSKIIKDLRKLKIDETLLSDKEVLEAAKMLDRIQQSTLQRFSTGVVTALPVEMAALEACFDDLQEIEMRGVKYKVASAPIRGSNSRRTLAIIKRANDAGNNMAAVCAANMLNAFPNIEDVIMVGIAGGVPYPENAEKHVRLGDIVVSDLQGITQYDYGKQYKNYFEEKQRGRPPSPKLIDNVNELFTLELKGERPWEHHIEELQLRLEWERPSNEFDLLFRSDEGSNLIPHPVDSSRQEGKPRVFRGKIGSANLVLKSGEHRKRIREKHGVIAVEMESSGIADATWSHRAGYLVIRGICDYSDGHKNDKWHKYASLVAAAYCRAILEI
jgi:nucleoside phosphorylase